MKVIFEENPSKTTYYTGTINDKYFTLIESYNGDTDTYEIEVIQPDDEDLTDEEHQAITDKYESKFNLNTL